MNILVILEDNHGSVHKMSIEAIVAAQSLNGSISAIVIGENHKDLASEVSNFNVKEILTVDDSLVASYSADGYTEVLHHIINQMKPDLIICSYHGIPKSYFDKGDPYHCYCHKTTRLMQEKFNKIDIRTTFQSRFGPQEWLKPYTDKTLETLPKEGIKNLLVICPGFASDCVETLEEINIQGRDSFLESGGKNFDLVPCLNDNEDHINLFDNLIKKYL